MAKRQPCLMFGSLLFPNEKSSVLPIFSHSYGEDPYGFPSPDRLRNFHLAVLISFGFLDFWAWHGRWPQVTKQGERFIVVYATAARSGLSEFAVFFTLRRDKMHPHTSSSHDFTYLRVGSGGSGNVSVHLLTSLMLRKDFIPNSVHTKNAKSELLNAWNYGDTIIAMPCGKWFPQFSKHFANETLHLQVTQVKRDRKNGRW